LIIGLSFDQSLRESTKKKIENPINTFKTKEGRREKNMRIYFVRRP